MKGASRRAEYTTCSSRSQLAVSSSVATFANTARPSSSVTTQRRAGVCPPVVTGPHTIGSTRRPPSAVRTFAISRAVGSTVVCEDRPSMGEFVRIGTQGGVATIRIDRPPANALAHAVSVELSEAAETVTGDDAVRAVVVWGGEKIFAAGADIKAMVDYGPDEISADVGALERACRDLEAIPKITIAAINGFALGGGLEVALACDFRFAARDARLGLPEIKLGIIPGSGGTQRLPRLVGLAKARDLIFTGRQVDAAEALAIGLVDRVAPAAEALGLATDDARAFAEGPSLAYAAAKRALAAADLPLEDGLGIERQAFVPLFATRDQQEGMRAFLDRREPKFEGR
jgi:enoyl-CoA hydratase